MVARAPGRHRLRMGSPRRRLSHRPGCPAIWRPLPQRHSPPPGHRLDGYRDRAALATQPVPLDRWHPGRPQSHSRLLVRAFQPRLPRRLSVQPRRLRHVALAPTRHPPRPYHTDRFLCPRRLLRPGLLGLLPHFRPLRVTAATVYGASRNPAGSPARPPRPCRPGRPASARAARVQSVGPFRPAATARYV